MLCLNPIVEKKKKNINQNKTKPRIQTKTNKPTQPKNPNTSSPTFVSGI